MKRLLRLSFSLFLLTVLFCPPSALAVPPPDFLFNVGSQILQFFSVAVIFLGAFFSLFYEYLKIQWHAFRSSPKKVWLIGMVVVLIVSGVLAYGYGQYQQNREYEKWLIESEAYADGGDYMSEETVETQQLELDINQLSFEGDEASLEEAYDSQAKFISHIESKDAHALLIEEYYGAIANGEYEKAYELSKKSASFETFKSWYVDTTQIVLDKLVRIDDVSSSLELTLYEGEHYIRYGVLMDLKVESGEPVSVADSSVKVLSEGSVLESGVSSESEEVDYSEEPISISNEDFDALLESGDSHLVLDARENIEYENGYFPSSTHIRFADLLAGKWIEVPSDTPVYVFCWSGIRGKEVAEFLRTKNILAYYLEGGANGWVDWGGLWVGNVDFSATYSEERYKLLYTTEQVKDKVEEGVVLVDTREPWSYATWHIEGSINIPILYTSTDTFDEAFDQVPANSTIITVCDGYVNCFDAKVTAVELERRGHTFLGRYSKPWEYE